MLISIDYQIKYVEGEHHLYVLVGDYCTVLHSSYHYRPCYEVMQLAKKMQKLATTVGVS